MGCGGREEGGSGSIPGQSATVGQEWDRLKGFGTECHERGLREF